MKGSKRIFVSAWEYFPLLSGESMVCRKALEHSKHDYDLCCNPEGQQGGAHIRIFPVSGSKYISWPFAVAKQFKKLDAEEDYKVIMSRVMPPNGHFAGWLIKKIKPEIKWIVYFSDPIWNSPFLKFSLWCSKDHRPNWLLMKLFGFPAKWAIREGNLLVFNNERLARYVLGNHYEQFRGKVVISPYGHEGIHPKPVPNRKDGKFRLTHVGQIYGDRTLTELIAGLEQLKRENPILLKRLEICMVGFVCEEEQTRIAQSSVREAFVSIGQVPYDESLQAMYESDCLLVIDPVFDTPTKNIYVPGKIYDYMSTGKPIMCICDRDSATADVANVAGCIIVPPSGDQVYKALRSILLEKPMVDLQLYDAFCLMRHENKLDQAIASLLE